jgi:hypothetical protein
MFCVVTRFFVRLLCILLPFCMNKTHKSIKYVVSNLFPPLSLSVGNSRPDGV